MHMHTCTGLLYTYLANGCGNKRTEGAFRALQRGYIHWASGRLDQLEVNYRHPEYCHVRCNMTPSMKSGLYRVYLLLGKEGCLATIIKATCECAAGYVMVYIALRILVFMYMCIVICTGSQRLAHTCLDSFMHLLPCAHHKLVKLMTVAILRTPFL